MVKRVPSSPKPKSAYGPKPHVLRGNPFPGAIWTSPEFARAARSAILQVIYAVPAPNVARALELTVSASCLHSNPCQHSIMVTFRDRAALRATVPRTTVAGLMRVLGVRPPPPASRHIRCEFFAVPDADEARARTLLGLPVPVPRSPSSSPT
jgi:hypothetical protein